MLEVPLDRALWPISFITNAYPIAAKINGSLSEYFLFAVLEYMKSAHTSVTVFNAKFHGRDPFVILCWQGRLNRVHIALL